MVKSPKKLRIEGDVPQQEAEEARDAILKRMLSTPPKPRADKRGTKQAEATKKED